MAVDRCICQNVSFVRLKQIAHERQLGFSALCEQTRCGRSCGLCAPYIRLMLKTGETHFRVLPLSRIRELMSEPETAEQPTGAQGR